MAVTIAHILYFSFLCLFLILLTHFTSVTEFTGM